MWPHHLFLFQWSSIDNTVTFGYAQSHPEWRLSRRLRTVRKATASVTGLHGVLSGKSLPAAANETLEGEMSAETANNETTAVVGEDSESESESEVDVTAENPQHNQTASVEAPKTKKRKKKTRRAHKTFSGSAKVEKDANEEAVAHVEADKPKESSSGEADAEVVALPLLVPTIQNASGDEEESKESPYVSSGYVGQLVG